MDFQERYTPQVIGTNKTAQVTGIGIGGFICVTSGNITVTRGGSGGVVIDNFPVTAGTVYGIPMTLGSVGNGIFQTTGGASGTILVQ